jgi:hypothetical protein
VELKCPWFHRVELKCPWFHRVELNLVHPCEPWSSRCPWFHRVELLLIFLAGGRAGSPPRQKANKVGRMVVKVAKTDATKTARPAPVRVAYAVVAKRRGSGYCFNGWHTDIVAVRKVFAAFVARYPGHEVLIVVKHTDAVRLQLHALALQSREFPAHAGDTRADQRLVADEPEGKADQDQREGRQPRPLCRFSDGRSRHSQISLR